MKRLPCLAKSLWKHSTNSHTRGCVSKSWHPVLLWLFIYVFLYLLIFPETSSLFFSHPAATHCVSQFSPLHDLCKQRWGSCIFFLLLFFIPGAQFSSGFFHQHSEMWYPKDNQSWIPACCASFSFPLTANSFVCTIFFYPEQYNIWVLVINAFMWSSSAKRMLLDWAPRQHTSTRSIPSQASAHSLFA